MTKLTKKEQIMLALTKFISQRSGIVWGDYATRNLAESRRAYRSDYQTIAKHGRDARVLIRFIETHDTITAENIMAVSNNHSLRLELKDTAKGICCDYTTGQNFATEYRAGACKLLASVIWDWLRTCGYKTGDEMRAAAKRAFGAGMAKRWFN